MDKVISKTKSKTFSTVEDRTFSAASIKEKLRLMQKAPKVRFRAIVIDFKRYAQTQGVTDDLKSLMKTELSGLFQSISTQLAQGISINSLIGLTQFSKQLNDAGRNLMKSAKRCNGNPVAQAKFVKDYNQFLNELVNEILK